MFKLSTNQRIRLQPTRQKCA